MPVIPSDPYQPEWDANTLAEAEEIKSDAARMERAKQAAALKVKEQEERSRAMKKVAGKPVPKEKPTYGTPTQETGQNYNVKSFTKGQNKKVKVGKTMGIGGTGSFSGSVSGTGVTKII